MIGVSRAGNTGTDAAGSRGLINLNFRVNNVGTSQVSVVNATLRDGSLSNIPGLSWFGGSLVGN